MRAARAVLALGLGLVGALSLLPPAPALAVDGLPTRLSIVVPLVAPANSTGLISAQALALYTAPGGVLTRQLDAVVDTPVAIGIDPMIVVSIRVLGTSAPESALAWLDRLAAATNDTFALAYADTDLTLALQAGERSIPQPDGFDFAVDPALFAPAPAEGQETTPTPSPTPSAEPEDPAVPTLPTAEELLAWPYTLPDIAWPRSGTATAADLAGLVQQGYATTILSSANAVTATGAVAAEAAEARLLVADEATSIALRDAAAGALPATAVSGAAAANGSGFVLATTDRFAPSSSSVLAEVITALAADPSISLVRITDALDETPATATVMELPQSADRLARAGSLLTAEAADRRFATIAERPELILSERRLSLLAMLSNAWTANPTGWMRASEASLDDSVQLRDSVRVADIANLLLVADNDQYLPVNVDNGLDQAVTVYVTLRPTTAVLAVLEPRVQVVIPAASQAPVDVPVQSLTNGTVGFVVTLSNEAGQSVGNAVVGEVNVQAGWETPIVIVIAGIVVAIFGVGIVRTILRRRRATDD
jgi:hypothetical protein